jgi:hypothetical protein
MSFARIVGREQSVTEETSSHHAFSATHTLGYPLHVLARAKREHKFDMIQEVKCVAAKKIKSFAGRLYKIVKLFLMNLRCCSWASRFQSVPS